MASLSFWKIWTFPRPRFFESRQRSVPFSWGRSARRKLREASTTFVEFIEVGAITYIGEIKSIDVSEEIIPAFAQMVVWAAGRSTTRY
jgi:hypothetical protein